MKLHRNTTATGSPPILREYSKKLLPVVSAHLFLLLGADALVLLLQSASAMTAKEAILVICGGSLLHGIWGFWQHGGRHFTAAGMVSFSFALFVGFAGIYSVTNYGPGADPARLLPAAAYSFSLQVILYYGWRQTDTPRHINTTHTSIPADTARWGSWVGLIMVGVSVTATNLGAVSGVFNQFAVSGAVLFSLSLFCGRSHFHHGLSAVITLVLVAVLASVIFTGFGRLQLGALGLGAAASAAYRFRYKLVKVVLLFATAPVLIYLAHRRVEFTAQLNVNQTGNVSGFESVISPLSRFGDLLYGSHNGTVDPHYLSSFFATLVAFVPRTLWPEKPPGFGAVLADYFYPGSSSHGYSAVALSQGEWVWAFGIAGPIIMLPVLGISVRMADRIANQCRSQQDMTISGLVKLAMLTVIISGMPDLLWGGTFNFITRSGLRILLLGLVLLMINQRDKNSPRT